MADISPLWDAYASHQKKLADRRSVDDLAWGLEASLNRLLDQQDELVSEADLRRTFASEGRRARYRRALLIRYSACVPQALEPTSGLEARSKLAVLERRLNRQQIKLLIEFGKGASSAELAAREGVTEPTARARMSRVRRVARAALEQND